MAGRVLIPGSVVADRFRLTEQLGRGGMGVVFEAIDQQTKQPAAIKFLDGNLLADLEAETRFKREISAAQAIDHPSVVKVLASGVTDSGVPWYAMERLEGVALADVFKRQPRFPASAACALGLKLLDALDAAHGAGVVHRDVKPANIYLEPSTRRLRLLDFGIARLLAGETIITRTGVAVGTPLFMSPEQILGERDVGPAADLFSLGVILYRMATGRAPFSGESALALMKKVVTEEPPPMPGVPEALQQVVRALMQREPAERPTAAEIRPLLEQLGDDELLWKHLARIDDATEIATEGELVDTPMLPDDDDDRRDERDDSAPAFEHTREVMARARDAERPSGGAAWLLWLLLAAVVIGVGVGAAIVTLR